MLNKMALLFVLIGVLATVTARTVAAQKAAKEDGWQFSVELYGWGANIGGKSASGSDIDLKLDDIFDNLELAFMGAFGVHKGKWAGVVDVIYLDLEDDATLAPGLNANVELKSWIVTPVVGYKFFETEKVSFHVLGGARYLSLKADLGLTGFPDVSDSGSVWDGIAGVKGRVNLTKKWYVSFYGDIGTGDSDLTWQAMAQIAYMFKWCDVSLGYRHLDWDFDDNAALDDLNVSGPYVGIKFTF